MATVIGNIVNDRIAGSAVGTIDKRIAESPVCRIKEFLQTILANRYIRRNQGGTPQAGCTGEDRKIVQFPDDIRSLNNVRDVGQRRKI